MNIKELAKQAEIEGVAGHIRALERFARLAYAAGAAAEREECAKLCQRFSDRMMSAGECADAIRARSKA